MNARRLRVGEWIFNGTPRREEIHSRMREAMWVLDGTTKTRVALLTGISPDDIDRLGGIDG